MIRALLMVIGGTFGIAGWVSGSDATLLGGVLVGLVGFALEAEVGGARMAEASARLDQEARDERAARAALGYPGEWRRAR